MLFTVHVHCHHTAERRQEFIPPEMWPTNLPDLNHVDYDIWVIHDVKELKERLLS